MRQGGVAAGWRPGIAIPCYNHGGTLEAVLRGLENLALPCVVVDDGSSAGQRELAREACAKFPWVTLRERAENGGKGAAVIDAVEALAALGCTHALQVDADGQHDLGDARKLLDASRDNPAAVVSGEPVYDESAPRGRVIGRRITAFWVTIETLSRQLRDTMCGFRVYPAGPFLRVTRRGRIGLRMDFDIEILVRLFWDGVPVRFIPTRVIYPEGGTSSFDYLRDNLRISRMHAKLCLEAPRHWARRLFARRGKGTGWSSAPERRGAAGIRILMALGRALGPRALALAMRPVILGYWLTGGEAKRSSRAFLARVREAAAALPEKPRWEEPLGSYRHFLHFGRSMADRIAAWQGGYPAREDIVFEGAAEENLTPAAPGARGRLLLTSHFGAADLCRAVAARSRGVRVTVLLYEDNAEGFRTVLEEIAPESRPDVVPVSSIGVETAVKLSEKVEQGGWVAIAADRAPVKRGEGAVRVSRARFLGGDAFFPVGPYVLASLLSCPVYTLFAWREGERFRIICEMFADRVLLPRGAREAALSEYASRFAAQLEAVALRAPLEWFNFYDFWADPNAEQKAENERNT